MPKRKERVVYTCDRCKTNFDRFEKKPEKQACTWGGCNGTAFFSGIDQEASMHFLLSDVFSELTPEHPELGDTKFKTQLSKKLANFPLTGQPEEDFETLVAKVKVLLVDRLISKAE